ncbi:hypothetical protein PASE110613_14460 [Paenibacillus sediminis]|uniref:Uncharacterized protein n=1 Tax=Paenibacillus sediminis TaxID=664909 RepID=A0ABS4H7J2_9BACL|nr:hypothetical protein [Paenibacillus sediminis]MBP1938510.1 hypothetical protein [Paenibacillus sediminis]
MGKRNRLSISFKHKYLHVFEYLQCIPNNKSDYIAKAVEAYMTGNKTAGSHEEIREIVLKVLREQGNMPLLNPTVQADSLSVEDVELINELF